jgi:hypothetical protein
VLTPDAHTYADYRFAAEVFCFTDQAVPRTLEMRLAEVRGRVKVSPAPAPPSAAPAEDFTAALMRLSELLDKGHLTEEEFGAAKARLLNGH